MDIEIFDLLNKALIDKTSVRLHNLYKGVPISSDAEIMGLDNLYVYMRASQYQIANIYLERGTYIMGKNFPYSLRAQVSRIDIERGDIFLTNVVKVNGWIGQRGQVRVEPQDPVWVGLQAKNTASSVTTRLADLSSTGLGIFMERYYFQPHIFKVGLELKVKFILPKSGLPTSLVSDVPRLGTSSLGTRFGREQLRGINMDFEDAQEGKRDKQQDARLSTGHIFSDALVIHIRPELYLNRYRIGLRLVNDEVSSKILSSYISQRQSDLIREFRLVYESLAQQKPVI